MGARRGRFEGWYFKHSVGGRVFSFIPGLSVGPAGERSAFLQVVSTQGSHFFRFPPEAYHADPDACRIRVGDSRFDRSGASLAVAQDGVEISGRIGYSGLHPIRRSLWSPTLMGPFSYLRFLECSHDVVSLHHTLSGSLRFDGEEVDFTGGTGYIERDAGRSFPRAWIWYQSCDFPRPGDCVMLAAAWIPLGALSFPGLLCVCSAGGEEYRLATYSGGRLERLERRGDCLGLLARQGALSLRIRVRADRGRELLAPLLGDMTRTIREYPCCESDVLLKRGGEVLLRGAGACAGFEQVGEIGDLLPKK